MGNYNPGTAHLQEEVGAWVWQQIYDAGPDGIGDPLHTPSYSEFDIRAPGGAWATVRVEVRP